MHGDISVITIGQNAQLPLPVITSRTLGPQAFSTHIKSNFLEKEETPSRNLLRLKVMPLQRGTLVLEIQINDVKICNKYFLAGFFIRMHFW